MNIRTQILVVVLAVAALFWIIRKICRKGIEVKYSLLWILLGIGVIIFACFPQFTAWLAQLFGIGQPINMVFFAGFCFALVIIFSLSVAVSRLSNKVKRLTQEMALMEKKIEDQKENKWKNEA